MSPGWRERAIRILEIVCWAAMALFLIQAFHRAYRPYGYDLTPRLVAARALVNGLDPYKVATPFPLTYPLFICVILLPLAWLPYWAANLAWFLISLACVLLSMRVVLRLVNPQLSRRELRQVAVLCFLPLTNVVQSNFVNGQVNFLVLALCVLFFKSLLQRQPSAAGLLLGAAVAVKLTPLILAVYLLVRREWAALWWTGLGVLLFVFVLPYALGGPAVLDYYRGYFHGYVIPALGSGGTHDVSGAFALSSYLRVLVPFLPGLALLLVSSALVLTPLVFLQLRASSTHSTRVQVLLFSAYLVASLLILPISETHHLAALFPALLVLTWYFLMEDGAPRARGMVPLAAAFLLLLLGQLSFAFYFAAIGTLYVLLCYLSAGARCDRGSSLAL